MPLPRPMDDESQEDFIQRCVIDPNIQDEFVANEQRLAVCNSIYREEVFEGLVDIIGMLKENVDSFNAE